MIHGIKTAIKKDIIFHCIFLTMLEGFPLHIAGCLYAHIAVALFFSRYACIPLHFVMSGYTGSMRGEHVLFSLELISTSHNSIVQIVFNFFFLVLFLFSHSAAC